VADFESDDIDQGVGDMAALACIETASRAASPASGAKSIKDALKEAAAWWGWQGYVRHDSATETDYITTTYIRHGEIFVYTLTANERLRRAGIHVTSPIEVPGPRIVDAVLVANYFNARTATGSYHVAENGDLCYLWAVSVAGASVTVELFRMLRDAANKAFDDNYKPFLDAAFTTNSASRIVEKHRIFSRKD
jgi:hypothetical protein